jgi:hypothetical protein
MLSNNDLIIVIWILFCYALILFTPGRISKSSYSRLMAFIFIFSCLIITWFHETVIDVSQASPIHGAILSFAQVGTLTLTSKLWLTLNFRQFSKTAQKSLYAVIYSALCVVTICAYWLYKEFPELQIILLPFASLAISITAEALENRWT